MPFLSDQKNWRAPRPPPTLIFSPKSTDQHFEIAISFRTVENHNNYVFGNDLLPPQSLGEGLQVTNFDQCLHTIMVIGKCTDVFQGNVFGLGGGVRGGGHVGGSFLGGICHGGRKIQWKGRRIF